MNHVHTSMGAERCTARSKLDRPLISERANQSLGSLTDPNPFNVDHSYSIAVWFAMIAPCKHTGSFVLGCTVVVHNCSLVTLLNDCWNQSVKLHSSDKFVCILNLGGAHTREGIPCCLKCQSAAVISFLLTKLLSKAIASAKSSPPPLSSGSKWQLNRLDWAFVWALTEAFHEHAHKPNVRYSWLVAETGSSSFVFLKKKKREKNSNGLLLFCSWFHQLLWFLLLGCVQMSVNGTWGVFQAPKHLQSC